MRVPALKRGQFCLDFGQTRLIGGRHALVIIFRDPDDNVHHIWKAAAASSTHGDGVIDLCRDDELPRIVNEKLGDSVLDVAFRDHIAVADEHSHPRSAGVQGSGGKAVPDITSANMIVNVRYCRGGAALQANRASW